MINSREERYKEALKTCDCRVWISMIKALYLRRKDRLEQGKKMTDLDERYFKTAEENLYSELALSLGMKKDEMVSYIKGRCWQKHKRHIKNPLTLGKKGLGGFFILI